MHIQEKSCVGFSKSASEGLCCTPNPFNWPQKPSRVRSNRSFVSLYRELLIPTAKRSVPCDFCCDTRRHDGGFGANLWVGHSIWWRRGACRARRGGAPPDQSGVRRVGCVFWGFHGASGGGGYCPRTPCVTKTK